MRKSYLPAPGEMTLFKGVFELAKSTKWCQKHENESVARGRKIWGSVLHLLTAKASRNASIVQISGQNIGPYALFCPC